MNGRTDSRTRSLVLLAVLLLAGCALVARLAYWQIGRHDELAARARLQVGVRIETPSVRGTIYDRNGTTVLATTVERDRLVAYPAQLVVQKDDAATAALQARIGDRLVEILHSGAEQAASIRAALASAKPYVLLARDLTPVQSAAVRSGMGAGQLPQIRLEPEYTRVYPGLGGAPETSLAAHVLGFVNREGTGQYGIEGKWQEALAGSPRVTIAQKDGAGRPAYETAEVVTEGVTGADLTLTIDASLQLKVEQEVYAAAVADRAKSVSALVMDPATGAILASASYPSYDANQYRTIATRNPGVFLDPTISASYEPGSVFKMVTAAAALRAGVVKRSTMISDQAVLVLDKGEARVRNADRGSKGRISFEDGVAWSRNVIMSKVALRLGSSTRKASTVLYKSWTDFGFGRTTGVDLAGEVGGIARDPATTDWAQVDLANGSFGQGVAVTLVQLASAFSAMVNGGRLPVPHVVAAVDNKPVDLPDPDRIITAQLSHELVLIMKRVVTAVPFYAKGTRIKGYVVGGKTGTAQIWDSKKQEWRHDVYNFSFAGFVGRTSPDLVVVVRIDEGRPLINRAGNIVNAVESFELFRRIATDGMSTLDLLPAGRTIAATDPAAKARAAAGSAKPGSKGQARPGASPGSSPTRSPDPSADPGAEAGDGAGDAAGEAAGNAASPSPSVDP